MNGMVRNWVKPGLFGLVVVALLSSSAALAGKHGDCEREHGKMGHHGMGGMMMHMADELGLSDSQRAEIKAIMESARDDKKGVWKEMKQSRMAIREAIHNGASDEELRKLAMDEADVRADMLISRAQIHRKIQAVLTEEQRAKAEALRKEHETKREKRWSEWKERKKESE